MAWRRGVISKMERGHEFNKETGHAREGRESKQDTLYKMDKEK